MKNFLVNFEDLIPIANGPETDKIVLYVRKEDVGKDGVLGVKVYTDCSVQQYVFGVIDNFFNYTPWDFIDTNNETLVAYYRDRLAKTLPDDTILDLLERFRDELEKWDSLENKYQYQSPGLYGVKDVYNEKK